MLRYLRRSCCEYWRQYSDGSHCQANRKHQGRKSVVNIHDHKTIVTCLTLTCNAQPHCRDSNSCGNSVLCSCHNCCCCVSWTPLSSHWSSPWLPLGEGSCVPHWHHCCQCTRGTSGYSHCKWKHCITHVFHIFVCVWNLQILSILHVPWEITSTMFHYYF